MYKLHHVTDVQDWKFLFSSKSAGDKTHTTFSSHIWNLLPKNLREASSLNILQKQINSYQVSSFPDFSMARLLLFVISDMIKGNESDVGNIDFDLQA